MVANPLFGTGNREQGLASLKGKRQKAKGKSREQGTGNREQGTGNRK
ncbi:MAG: hypothetical protein AB4426_17355 [Xenococcaceae cyanobacterium]